ncbi:hypothetical protein BJ166DRAFT_500587 [Pestalotiopsis sp. NC0098]|nr:hypothetical protein BJ166DRAFT_500587 [Pestalotiopsis sp. NC0098]
MLRSLLTYATLLAGAVQALPVAEEAAIAEMEARSSSSSIPTEENGACYVAAGSSCPSTAVLSNGDHDDGKSIGLVLHNPDTQDRMFFIYKNNCDCVPVKYLTIPAGGKKFVAFPADFQGRLQRGTTHNLDGKTHRLGTWMEFSWDKNGWGWADVSLIKGCDGAVSVKAIDGIGASQGFTDDVDVLVGAPTGAYKKKAGGGAKVIMETENVSDYKEIYTTPRNWLAGKLGWDKAYIDDYHGNPDICSTNGRFDITFYPGRS